MKFINQSCEEFVEVLGSKASVPGGGGACAFVAALGIALGNMVSNLTIGKKKYANVEQELIEIRKRCENLQKDFLVLVDEDAKAFEPLSELYRMKTTTEEEQKRRDSLMEEALCRAANVPYEIIKKCCEAIGLMDVLARKGSVLAISDAGVGAAFCKAAMQSASLNVYINTKYMKDRNKANAINQEVQEMLETYLPMADEIFTMVDQKLQA